MSSSNDNKEFVKFCSSLPIVTTFPIQSVANYEIPQAEMVRITKALQEYQLRPVVHFNLEQQWYYKYYF
jgi:hypothetical protein